MKLLVDNGVGDFFFFLNKIHLWGRREGMKKSMGDFTERINQKIEIRVVDQMFLIP